MALFTFDTTVPASGNNPSQDQPVMLNNNVATNGIIATDHVTFNANNGGQHKAITFNQDASYVPVPPVSPPQLFTDTVAGLAQLKYYSGDAAHSANQYVVGTQGSTFLLGGMILKWGTGGASPGPGYQTTTFASAFPNNCFTVIICASDPLLKDQIAVVSSNASSFVASRIGLGSVGINYIAIGD